MSLKPPLVPSRSALRALRRLAFAGSTVIGTVGSISAVAFVGYDVRQRIRLAERIIETRRTLAAISNPHRKAHMAKMFELAEGGEYNGLLETSRQEQRRRVNSQSSAAEEKSLGQSEDGVQEHQQDVQGSYDITPRDTTIEVENNPNARSHNLHRGKRNESAPRDLDTTLERTTIPNVHRQSSLMLHNQTYGLEWTTSRGLSKEVHFAVPRRRHVGEASSRRSSAAQRIMEATQQQHKVNSHTVYGRPHKPKEATDDQLADSIQKWLGPNRLANDAVISQNDKGPRHINSLSKPRVPQSKNAARPVEAYRSPITPGSIRMTSTGGRLRGPARQRSLHTSTLRKAQQLVETPRNETEGLSSDVTSSKDGTTPSSQIAQDLQAEAGFLIGSFGGANNTESMSKHRPIHNVNSAGTEASGNLEGFFDDSARENTDSWRNTETKKSQDVDTGDLDVLEKLAALIAYYRSSVGSRISQELHYGFDISQYPSNMHAGRRLSSSPTRDSDYSQTIHNSPTSSVEANQPNADTFLGKEPLFEEHFRHLRTYLMLCDTINETRIRDGQRKAYRVFLEAMKIYSDDNSAESFQAMDDLCMALQGELNIPRSTTPYQRLIRHLLNSGVDGDRDKAAHLLFPNSQRGPPTSLVGKKVTTHFENITAKHYVDHLARLEEESAYKIILEFRKVILAAISRDATVTDSLFAPILHRFLVRREYKYLRKTYDEMILHHLVEPSLATRGTLLTGYALQGDWDRVGNEFASMHEQSISRKQPIGYSFMFTRIFTIFADAEPIERTHNFLINAMGYWGLVPTPKISTAAIQAYLTHKRYDYVKDWMQAVRTLFPQINTGGRAFTYALAESWGKLKSSCQDIEQACHALINDQDMAANGQFKEMVHEALARHLAESLQAAGEYEAEAKISLDLRANLESAFAMIASHTPKKGGLKPGPLADLQSQARAAARLNEFFGGENLLDALDSAAPSDQVSLTPLNSGIVIPDFGPIHSTFPKDLIGTTLPNAQKVDSLISTYYVQRFKAGLPVDHAILKYTCRRLISEERDYTVSRLISTVYDSPAVSGPQGVMFDVEIMQTWLKMAYILKSVKQCCHCFWALLTKGSELQLTRQFMLLANMTVDRARADRTWFNVGREMGQEEGREVEWMLKRLKERFLVQQKRYKPLWGHAFKGLLVSKEEAFVSSYIPPRSKRHRMRQANLEALEAQKAAVLMV